MTMAGQRSLTATGVRERQKIAAEVTPVRSGTATSPSHGIHVLPPPFTNAYRFNLTVTSAKDGR